MDCQTGTHIGDDAVEVDAALRLDHEATLEQSACSSWWQNARGLALTLLLL